MSLVPVKSWHYREIVKRPRLFVNYCLELVIKGFKSLMVFMSYKSQIGTVFPLQSRILEGLTAKIAPCNLSQLSYDPEPWELVKLWIETRAYCSEVRYPINWANQAEDVDICRYSSVVIWISIRRTHNSHKRGRCSLGKGLSIFHQGKY